MKRTRRRQHYHHILVNNLKVCVIHQGNVTFAFSDFINLSFWTIFNVVIQPADQSKSPPVKFRKVWAWLGKTQPTVVSVYDFFLWYLMESPQERWGTILLGLWGFRGRVVGGEQGQSLPKFAFLFKVNFFFGVVSWHQ